MPRPLEDDEHDLFDAFDDPGEESERLPSGKDLARSAGVTVALMVLTCLGFIGGAWLAGTHAPDIGWTSVVWEGVVLLLWSLLWGLLGGAAALAAGFVLVGLPWVRRHRSRG